MNAVHVFFLKILGIQLWGPGQGEGGGSGSLLWDTESLTPGPAQDQESGTPAPSSPKLRSPNRTHSPLLAAPKDPRVRASPNPFFV